ncbi:hypothetical protein Fmac_028437 [Flemingia macrophylla]|uniref:LAGLIDADG homing endonuclease n=1 Tax=Flemingia macrophylla TaxID=520843 RepID=A0ABD1L7H8_9FABA
MNVRLPNDFYGYWNGLIKIGECKVVDNGGNIFKIRLKNIGRTVGQFTDGINNLIKFYGLRTKHEGVLTYHGSSKFSIRIYDISGDEIMLPGTSASSPETGLSKYGDEWNTYCSFAQYFPVAIVKDWVLSFFNKVLFLDEQDNCVLADIRGKYNRNKNEYYVGKEWGKLKSDSLAREMAEKEFNGGLFNRV